MFSGGIEVEHCFKMGFMLWTILKYSMRKQYTTNTTTHIFMHTCIICVPIFIYKEERLLLKMENQYTNVGISQLLRKILLMIYETHTVWLKIKSYYHFFLCLPPLQKNSDLSSPTEGFIILPFTTANLHIIFKLFTSTYLSINKSKHKTCPWYIIIIELFQNRSNVMQMSLYN